MSCPRCNGLLICSDDRLDVDSGRFLFQLCVNCGHQIFYELEKLVRNHRARKCHSICLYKFKGVSFLWMNIHACNISKTSVVVAHRRTTCSTEKIKQFHVCLPVFHGRWWSFNLDPLEYLYSVLQILFLVLLNPYYKLFLK